METVDEPEAISDTLQPNPESDGPIDLLLAANVSGSVLITVEVGGGYSVMQM